MNCIRPKEKVRLSDALFLELYQIEIQPIEQKKKRNQILNSKKKREFDHFNKFYFIQSS